MSYLNDPEYWRERAKETRAMAEHVTDLAGKRTMSTIADECTRKICDEIAASLADAKQRSKPVIEAAASLNPRSWQRLPLREDRKRAERVKSPPER